MFYLAQQAIQRNLPVELHAIEPSIPFYRKFHFEQLSHVSRFHSTAQMRLTVEKIQTLIERKAPPFNTFPNS